MCHKELNLKVLQNINFTDTKTIKAVSIDFIIKSDFLEPAEITKKLGIKPTRAWAKGDKYLGKTKNVEKDIIEECWREKPWGIWAIDTNKIIKSKSIKKHIELILNMLIPKKVVIKEYINDKSKYNICFYILLETYNENDGFELESDILKKMSDLSHYVEFRFIFNEPNNE